MGKESDSQGAALGGQRLPDGVFDLPADDIIAQVVTPLEPVSISVRFVTHLIDDHPASAHRERFAREIIPTFQDPVEIWHQPTRLHDRVVHRRVFIRAVDGLNTVAVAQEESLGWFARTFYPKEDINSERYGYLIYRSKYDGQ